MVIKKSGSDYRVNVMAATSTGKHKYCLTGQAAKHIVMLNNLGAPFLFLMLVSHLCMSKIFPLVGDVTLLETFAGKKNVSKAFKERGHFVQTFEINDDPLLQDILSALGYLNLIVGGLRTKQGGANVNGPVCSSWVFLSRSTTQRSLLCPLGNPRVRCVAQGNEMVARLMLFILVMCMKGVWWLIEQPSSSLMHCHPRFAWMMRSLPGKIHKQFVWLGAYGAESKKGIHLYSQHAFVQELYRPLPTNRVWQGRGIVTHATKADGSVSVSGGAKLKETQTYPKAFGLAIERVYSRHKDEIMKSARDMQEQILSKGVPLEVLHLEATSRGQWSDAKLMEVWGYLVGSDNH